MLSNMFFFSVFQKDAMLLVQNKKTNSNTQSLLLGYVHSLRPFSILVSVSWMRKAAFLRQLATCQERSSARRAVGVGTHSGCHGVTKLGSGPPRGASFPQRSSCRALTHVL